MVSDLMDTGAISVGGICRPMIIICKAAHCSNSDKVTVALVGDRLERMSTISYAWKQSLVK